MDELEKLAVDLHRAAGQGCQGLYNGREDTGGV